MDDIRENFIGQEIKPGDWCIIRYNNSFSAPQIYFRNTHFYYPSIWQYERFLNKKKFNISFINSNFKYRVIKIDRELAINYYFNRLNENIENAQNSNDLKEVKELLETKEKLEKCITEMENIFK